MTCRQNVLHKFAELNKNENQGNLNPDLDEFLRR